MTFARPHPPPDCAHMKVCRRAPGNAGAEFPRNNGRNPAEQVMSLLVSSLGASGDDLSPHCERYDLDPERTH